MHSCAPAAASRLSRTSQRITARSESSPTGSAGGKPIYEGRDNPLATSAASGNRRITVSGQLKLGANMKEGDYGLQVVITDSSGAKAIKHSQRTDFRVVNN